MTRSITVELRLRSVIRSGRSLGLVERPGASARLQWSALVVLAERADPLSGELPEEHSPTASELGESILADERTARRVLEALAVSGKLRVTSRKGRRPGLQVVWSAFPEVLLLAGTPGTVPGVDHQHPGQDARGVPSTPDTVPGVGHGTVHVQTDLEGSSDPGSRSEDPDPGGEGEGVGEGEPSPTSTPSSPAPGSATGTHTAPEDPPAPPAHPASFLQPVTPPPAKVSPARARRGGHEDIPEAELLPAERQVYDAILRAPNLAAITAQPARAARTLIGMIAASRREVEGPYQVILAEDWLSGPRGKKRSNGHAFLVNFMKNAIERAPLLVAPRPAPEASEREQLRAALGKLPPAALHSPAVLEAVERANRARFGEDHVLPDDPDQLRALMRSTRANAGKAARQAPPLASGELPPARLPRADGFPHERFGEAWLPPTNPDDPYNVPAEKLFVTKSVVDAQLAQAGGDRR